MPTWSRYVRVLRLRPVQPGLLARLLGVAFVRRKHLQPGSEIDGAVELVRQA